MNKAISLILLYGLFYYSLFYEVTQVYRNIFPKYIDYTDELIVSLMFVIAIYNFVRKEGGVNGKVVFWSISILGGLVVSTLYNNLGLMAIVGFLLSFSKPFIVVLFISSGAVPQEKIEQLLRHFFYIMLLQIPVCLYQLYSVGFSVEGDLEDTVQGLFKSGLTLAALSAYAFFYMYASFLSPDEVNNQKSRLKTYIPAILLFLMFLATGTKHMTIGVAFVVLLFLINFRLKLMFKVSLLIIVLYAAFVTFGIPLFEPYYPTIERFVLDPHSFPKHDVIERLTDHYQEDFTSFILGLGPGQFVSNFQTGRGIDLFSLFPGLMFNSYLGQGSIIDHPESTVLAVLGECGLLGFLLYFTPIVKGLIRIRYAVIEGYRSVYFKWTVMCLLLILFESLFLSAGEFISLYFIPSCLFGYCLTVSDEVSAGQSE